MNKTSSERSKGEEVNKSLEDAGNKKELALSAAKASKIIGVGSIKKERMGSGSQTLSNPSPLQKFDTFKPVL